MPEMPGISFAKKDLDLSIAYFYADDLCSGRSGGVACAKSHGCIGQFEPRSRADQKVKTRRPQRRGVLWRRQVVIQGPHPLENRAASGDEMLEDIAFGERFEHFPVSLPGPATTKQAIQLGHASPKPFRRSSFDLKFAGHRRIKLEAVEKAVE